MQSGVHLPLSLQKGTLVLAEEQDVIIDIYLAIGGA